MRNMIRKIVEGYKSLKIEVQEDGYIQFSGLDPNSQQVVSIKVLPGQLLQDPQIATRFRALSQSIRQLNHPNIAAVRKVGEESGLPYLVTQAIEKAQPLAAKLNQSWAVDDAADLVAQVAQALEHAYNKGVVHGALSPETVMVQDNGRVTVTDFGLRELQTMAGAQLRQIAPPFMAPEQAAGTPADARADVYALGAISYRLLAKRDPQIVKGEVLPPSRFNPDIPAQMDAVVTKALAQDPEDRYPDVKSFLAAFGSVTLAPMVKRKAGRQGTRCPQCGAANQTGRFCRACGGRLDRRMTTDRSRAEQSQLDKPIQITKIDVGHIEVGKGIEVQETVIAQPMAVATGEVLDQFPEPLAMPTLDTASLWSTAEGDLLIAMPEPPLMPVIDWAEVAPPMPEVPTIEESGTPDSQAEK